MSQTTWNVKFDTNHNTIKKTALNKQEDCISQQPSYLTSHNIMTNSKKYL